MTDVRRTPLEIAQPAVMERNQAHRVAPSQAVLIAAARVGDQAAVASLTEPHRRELQVHCYRILGSLHEAEDAVQETFLRAWRRLNTFEGRSSFRAWLYKIATNVCLDELAKRPKRVLPTSVYAPADPREPFAPPITENIWLEPCPDEWLVDAATRPEVQIDTKESITLAFLAMLQLLPPRQRAILILRDVLGWHTVEVAELLDVTISAANSALHRARTTLSKHQHRWRNESTNRRLAAEGEAQHLLLHRYVQAWEAADVTGLVALLKEDATLSMPPSPTWYRGREAIGAGVSAFALLPGSRNLWRLLPTHANGRPAFGLYQRDGQSGVFRAFGLQVLILSQDGDRIAEIIIFLNPELLQRFGLPDEIASASPPNA